MTPRDPEWEGRVRRAFAAQGMMATLQAEIVSAAPGRIVLAAPIRPETSQQHGFAHAALAFALGDTAQGFAAQSLMEPGRGVLTVEMKIQLLAPARGLRLRAEGAVERAGRRLTVTRADVFAETAEGETRVALLIGTMTSAADGPSSA